MERHGYFVAYVPPTLSGLATASSIVGYSTLSELFEYVGETAAGLLFAEDLAQINVLKTGRSSRPTARALLSSPHLLE